MTQEVFQKVEPNVWECLVCVMTHGFNGHGIGWGNKVSTKANREFNFFQQAAESQPYR